MDPYSIQLLDSDSYAEYGSGTRWNLKKIYKWKHFKSSFSTFLNCKRTLIFYSLRSVLRIRVTLTRIRILLFTLMRILVRVLPFTLMWIRILPFNLMRIRILPLTFFRFGLSNASKWTSDASTFSLWCRSEFTTLFKYWNFVIIITDEDLKILYIFWQTAAILYLIIF